MIAQADYILSIVPPRDAVSTAKRFAEAATGHVRDKDKEPLFYIDLNAISPTRARMLEAIWKDCPRMRFLDGGVSSSVPNHLIHILKQLKDHWSRPKPSNRWPLDKTQHGRFWSS